jgi:hypothetical protein
MLVSGHRINRMAKGKRIGLMVHITRGLIGKAKKMGWGSLTGRMGRPTKESSRTIISRDWENINGQMGESTSENGNKIKWTAKEFGNLIVISIAFHLE